MSETKLITDITIDTKMGELLYCVDGCSWTVPLQELHMKEVGTKQSHNLVYWVFTVAVLMLWVLLTVWLVQRFFYIGFVSLAVGALVLRRVLAHKPNALTHYLVFSHPEKKLSFAGTLADAEYQELLQFMHTSKAE